MLHLAAIVIPCLLTQPSHGLSGTHTATAHSQVPRHIVPCEIVYPDDMARDAYIPETWPDGIVPYAFDPNVDTTNQLRAVEAMRELMSVSGVKFVVRTTETDHIVFFDSQFNRAHVGVIGGGQLVEMNNWEIRYILVHELMHALGTWHEQQRPDRDDFVQINFENIEQGAEHNFDVRPTTVPVGSYDFDSVMHYGQFAFAFNGLPTISVLPPNQMQQIHIGQRDHLSDGDIFGLVAQYGPPVAADLTGENIVDAADLAILLAAWGTPGADLNNDGTTDSSDLAILLAAWTN